MKPWFENDRPGGQPVVLTLPDGLPRLDLSHNQRQDHDQSAEIQWFLQVFLAMIAWKEQEEECYQALGQEAEGVETAHPDVVQHGQGVSAFLWSALEEHFGQTGSLHCVVVGPRRLSTIQS